MFYLSFKWRNLDLDANVAPIHKSSSYYVMSVIVNVVMEDIGVGTPLTTVALLHFLQL